MVNIIFELEQEERPVAEAGREGVGQTEAEGEDNLSADHRSSEENSRPSELHEGHQVHPLVLRLLQEGVDPAVVPFHLPQRLKVPHHAGSEAWHPRHRLQEDTPSAEHDPTSLLSDPTSLPAENSPLVQGVHFLLEFVARQEVEAEPQCCHSCVGSPVHQTLRLPETKKNSNNGLAGLERFLPVLDSHVLRLLLGPDGMRQSVVAGLQFSKGKFSAEEILSSNSLNNGLGELIERLPFLFILFVGFRTATRIS